MSDEEEDGTRETLENINIYLNLKIENWQKENLRFYIKKTIMYNNSQSKIIN